MESILGTTYMKPEGTYPFFRWYDEEQRKALIAHNFRHWMTNPIPLNLDEKK